MDIIDCSVFIGPHNRTETDTSPESVLSLLDEAGIEKALVTSLLGIEHDHEKGNTITFEVCGRFPDRLIPLPLINPRAFLPRQNTAAKLKDQGARIVGFFPFQQGYPVEAYNFEQAVREAAEEGLPIFITIGKEGDASKIARILSDVEAPIVLRWGGHNLVSELLTVALGFPNIYLDIGYVAAAGGIEAFVAQIGTEHLVYGSNAPFSDIQSSLAGLQTADLSETDKEQIASGTILGILEATYAFH